MKIILILSLVSLTATQIIGLTNQDWELARQFAPLVRVHPEEKYFPISVEKWYLQQSGIILHVPQDDGSEIIIEHPTAQDLGNAQTGQAWVDLGPNKKQIYKGQPLKDGKVVADVYFNIVDKGKDENGNPAKLFQYWFAFAFNGPLKVPGIKVGTHEGDWEGIDLHARQVNGKWEVDKVFFYRHQAARSGGFEKAKKLEFKGTHPVVYLAQSGHPSYPATTSRLKTLFKYEDFDRTSKGGPKWETWNHLVHLLEEPWMTYKGHWGNPKVQAQKGGPLRRLRTKAKERKKVAKIKVKDGKKSSEFNLKVPTRVLQVAFIAPDFVESYVIKEKRKKLKRAPKKLKDVVKVTKKEETIYRLNGGEEIQQFRRRHKDNLFITNVKFKKGQKPQEFIVAVEGIEE